jgi:hypothetical protein
VGIGDAASTGVGTGAAEAEADPVAVLVDFLALLPQPVSSRAGTRSSAAAAVRRTVGRPSG